MGKARAVFSFFDAREASKESLKAKRAKGYNVPLNPVMKRKSRDDQFQSIGIDAGSGGKPTVTWTDEGFKFWSDSEFGILKPYKKKELTKLTERNGGSSECKSVATLKYERPGRYYMIIPITIKKSEPSEEAREVIAFDPGVRCFQTGFDSSGRVIEYGNEEDGGGITKIYKLGRRIDKLHSEIDTHKKDKYENKKERFKYKNRRRKMRRRCGELSYRISNLKRDLHWKMAKEITSHYDDVLISRFPVSQMIGREDRRIKRETVKKMLNWSHFQFRQRLIHKAEELGTVVHETSEHYTSKTCGRCGKIHWKLGGNKTFKCPHCHFTLDRDHNGARNIMIMNLSEYIGEINTTNTNPRDTSVSLGPSCRDSNHVTSVVG
jgi:putative transposase